VTDKLFCSQKDYIYLHGTRIFIIKLYNKVYVYVCVCVVCVCVCACVCVCVCMGVCVLGEVLL